MNFNGISQNCKEVTVSVSSSGFLFAHSCIYDHKQRVCSVVLRQERMNFKNCLMWIVYNVTVHTDLLYKLRQSLPLNYFLLLKSYIHYRHFRVKVGNEFSDLLPVHAGVPQGSVLGPLPPLHLRPSTLSRHHYRHIQRRYCDLSYRPKTRHCLPKATKQS
jgi:hypothetical protein